MNLAIRGFRSDPEGIQDGSRGSRSEPSDHRSTCKRDPVGVKEDSQCSSTPTGSFRHTEESFPRVRFATPGYFLSPLRGNPDPHQNFQPLNFNRLFAIITIVVFSLLAIATACDLRTREIPDWISVLIGVVAIVSSLLGWLGLSIVWVLAGGVVGLVIASALFRFAKLGGGDGKLIIALAMLVGPVGILIVLFGMAITGGVLSLIAMLRGQRDYAYVPAIAAGFVGYVGFVHFLV
ncbi:A24 family peptidase [Rhodopirellula baltica]|uniref:Prepilin type IV endopeptidase peptidase domain-containing protein n=1 Tax=Rhodopirellula baltica WH47 TaxID=991778 RepID=F2B020_RHOBT|nr:A24 family peptidase [Rhodopirellula baltica]EGF24773.1 hypothetical protein RBWH47_03140 [Rhodopirellula baltica WH47]